MTLILISLIISIYLGMVLYELSQSRRALEEMAAVLELNSLAEYELSQTRRALEEMAAVLELNGLTEYDDARTRLMMGQDNEE